MSKYVDIQKRDKITVGKKYKVKNLRTGATRNGTPYWAFDFYFYEKELKQMNIYKRVTMMSREKSWVKEGDWVELLAVNEYIVVRKYNNVGGITLYETLVCNFKKTKYEEGEN